MKNGAAFRIATYPYFTVVFHRDMNVKVLYIYRSRIHWKCKYCKYRLFWTHPVKCSTADVVTYIILTQIKLPLFLLCIK